MNRQPCHFSRHRPAHPHPVHRHNTPVILHVTVCAAHRRPLLAHAPAHAALREAWDSARAWVVGYYLIMPDHIHLFCAPGCHAPPPVNVWATYWKRLVSQAMPSLRGQWLPECWDTQMRTQQHYVRKLDYVADNPVRKKLVAKSGKWPYQGKICDLPWLC